MCSYTHITWKYELRNQYLLTELKGRRFSKHEYITVRGKMNFGKKRSVWPISTMQTEVGIARHFLAGSPEIAHHLECLQVTSHHFS